MKISVIFLSFVIEKRAPENEAYLNADDINIYSLQCIEDRALCGELTDLPETSKNVLR